MLDISLSQCRLKDVQGIYQLSQWLAQYFPQPQECLTGIYELVLNAIEHGNLGIGYEHKTHLIRNGLWESEVSRRLATPHYAGKRVHIRLGMEAGQIILSIRDEGKGFAWQDFLAQPEDTREVHGRGLRIALSGGFDHVLFNAPGNEVTCHVRGSVREHMIGGYPDDFFARLAL